MTAITHEERRAAPIDWDDIVGFQEKLNAATDEGKLEILANLLSNQGRSFESPPLAQRVIQNTNVG